MAVGAASREIGIVVYPGVQLAAVHGLTDLFAIAGRLTGESGRASLPVSHWDTARSNAQEFACVYHSDRQPDPQPAILIVPPTLNTLPDAEVRAAIGKWLLAKHGEGVVIVSICSGAFLVAETGLLDGCLVSSHWSCAQELMRSFPRIVVKADERIIEHSGILTAGGFMAWLDVGLILVERLLGDRVRDETARFLMSGADLTRPARQSPTFIPPAHADQAVLRAQELVHVRDGRDLALAAMADAARLERRTFIRRFVSATGMTPMAYCRAVRIARGRELLEASNLPLKEIADLLGYLDATSFTRAFRRAYNGTPGEFRRQSRADGAQVAPGSGERRQPRGTARNPSGRQTARAP